MKFNLSSLDVMLRERLLRSAGQLGISEANDGIKLLAQKSDISRIEVSSEAVTVYYNKVYEFFFGVKAFLASPDSKGFEIKCAFGELGVMLDCSRNAVRTVEAIKLFLDNLALMGYNQLQLYTEDTYEIEGEPYFG